MLRIEEWSVMKCFEKSFECFYEEVRVTVKIGVVFEERRHIDF